MLFNSYPFVFVFLPFALVTFYLCRAFFPKRIAVAWLLLLSFGFYAYWYPPFLLILIASYAVNYAGSLLLLRWRSPWLLAAMACFTAQPRGRRHISSRSAATARRRSRSAQSRP